MNEYLNCNVHKCNAPLNGRAWVTTCLHVFCSEHGSLYFCNNKTEVNCPVCNEVIIRENDTLLCHTNPSDMILAGLRPEKVIRLVEKSVKLWKCQMEAERRHDATKIRLLTHRIDENSEQFKQAMMRKDADWKAQLATLQGNYSDITNKLRQVNHELEIARAALRKYKAAYESMVDKPGPSPSQHLRPPPSGPPPPSPVFTTDTLMDDFDLPGLNPINRCLDLL